MITSSVVVDYARTYLRDVKTSESPYSYEDSELLNLVNLALLDLANKCNNLIVERAYQPLTPELTTYPYPERFKTFIRAYYDGSPLVVTDAKFINSKDFGQGYSRVENDFEGKFVTYIYFNDSTSQAYSIYPPFMPQPAENNDAITIPNTHGVLSSISDITQPILASEWGSVSSGYTKTQYIEILYSANPERVTSLTSTIPIPEFCTIALAYKVTSDALLINGTENSPAQSDQFLGRYMGEINTIKTFTDSRGKLNAATTYNRVG